MRRALVLRRPIAMVLCALHLAACASRDESSGSPPALGPESPISDDARQTDGQVRRAKPGLARLYIVHGDARKTPSPPPVSAAGVTNPAALLLLFAVGAVYEGIREKPDKVRYPDANHSLEDYWLGEHRIGAMSGHQYMALDLPPGNYSVSFRDLVSGRFDFLLTAGEIKYVWSYASEYGFGVHSCLVQCPDRVTQGKRVVADWPQPRAAAQ